MQKPVKTKGLGPKLLKISKIPGCILNGGPETEVKGAGILTKCIHRKLMLGTKMNFGKYHFLYP